MYSRIRKLLVFLIIIALICPLALANDYYSPRVELVYNYGYMTVGETFHIRSELYNCSRDDIIWESSDDAIATVSNGGTITALAPGRVVIRASCESAKDYCGVVILPDRITLTEGETYALPSFLRETYTIKDIGVSSASGSTGTSSERKTLDTEEEAAKVAKISYDGIITALVAGTAKLTVKYKSREIEIDLIVTQATPVVTPTPEPSSAPSAETGTTVDPNATPVPLGKIESLDCASETDQIVLVEYESGSTATLSLHEKLEDGTWSELLSCDAYVGSAGIGKTVEGDNKTPTGTYNLTTPFGLEDDPGCKMTYTKVTKYHYWCGTSGEDEYYNRLIDTRIISRARTINDEYLINYAGYYDYCMFIDYNKSGEAGKGSCTFLHCMGSKTYTDGGVAVPTDVMKQILTWVKPGIKIVIQ